MYRYIKSFIVHAGHDNVINLARCNYMSKDLHFAAVDGNHILCVKRRPALVFFVAIPFSSSLVYMYSTTDRRFYVKDCTVFPLSGEFEKSIAALCTINSCDTAAVHAHDGGLKISSARTKPKEGSSLGGTRGI